MYQCSKVSLIWKSVWTKILTSPAFVKKSTEYVLSYSYDCNRWSFPVACRVKMLSLPAGESFKTAIPVTFSGNSTIQQSSKKCIMFIIKPSDVSNEVNCNKIPRLKLEFQRISRLLVLSTKVIRSLGKIIHSLRNHKQKWNSISIILKTCENLASLSQA